jgi:hypothetical protein
MTMAAASTVLAAGGTPKKDAAAAAPAPAGPAPSVKKSIDFPIAGLAWGMTPKQVAAAIDKLIDDDYRPLYKETQPGVKMKALDAQVAEDKSQFLRGKIDFGTLPTGIDGTPLRGEYSYRNKEALMTLNRKGHATHFFFIQEKLWKVIDEVKLGDAGALGKTFPEVAIKLSTKHGVPGRVLPADATRATMEIDWKDTNTHLRVIERNDTALAIAYEDIGTVANLASLRVNKPAQEEGIDPSVAAIMRGADPPPPPPPEKKDEKKKGKK